MGRFGELDAAALAAAARVNLRLYDDDTRAEPFGDGCRFGSVENDFAARNRDAEAREDGLGLILVNLHRRVGLLRVDKPGHVTISRLSTQELRMNRLSTSLTLVGVFVLAVAISAQEPQGGGGRGGGGRGGRGGAEPQGGAA